MGTPRTGKRFARRHAGRWAPPPPDQDFQAAIGLYYSNNKSGVRCRNDFDFVGTPSVVKVRRRGSVAQSFREPMMTPTSDCMTRAS